MAAERRADDRKHNERCEEKAVQADHQFTGIRVPAPFNNHRQRPRNKDHQCNRHCNVPYRRRQSQIDKVRRDAERTFAGGQVFVDEHQGDDPHSGVDRRKNRNRDAFRRIEPNSCARTLGVDIGYRGKEYQIRPSAQ